MTVGKDVSMLFTDVVNCGQTDSVELKKLVYLYLINYAKTQPDLAILAVNTFVKVLPNFNFSNAEQKTVFWINIVKNCNSGFSRPKSAYSCPGCSNNGMYPCVKDNRISL
jgi:hypothetical protein|eukprot:31479-Pelagococcus_subviridis.AAC.31